MLIVIAAVFLSICRSGYYLTLRDGKTGGIYSRYRVSDGDRFSVGFIHSVNKSPLTDVYEIRGHKIYVVETIYYGFGAGVQTEILEGQTLTYGEHGEMIVSGFNLEMPHLSYNVGTVSDHVLTQNAQEISLRELCGKNSTVAFSCEWNLF